MRTAMHTGLMLLIGTATALPVWSQCQGPTDFDGDRRADVSVYHPKTGGWHIQQSWNGAKRVQNFGWDGATPVPGDYDGDALSDLAVFDATKGDWYLQLSTTGETIALPWGVAGCVPVPADYDGDHVTDMAMYLPASGTWYILQSRSLKLRTFNFGWNEAKAVPADYDGDGSADPAVYHPQTGNWYILLSSTGQQIIRAWGWPEAVAIPADYDGDRRADIAVYHPQTGNWYIQQSRDGKTRTQNWGSPGMIPVVADYDADGRADLTVYDPRDGSWFTYRSYTRDVKATSWGWSEAIPAANGLWNYYRTVVTNTTPVAQPPAPQPTPAGGDAIDVSNYVVLSKHKDLKAGKASITKAMYSAKIEGGNVRMSFEQPLNWSTQTGSNGKTIDGSVHIFWYEGSTLYGGMFDWHGVNQTVKTLSNIPGGYLDGKQPPKGAQVWFCLINRECTQRTNVVKSDNTWQ